MYFDKQFLSYDCIPQYTGANSVQKMSFPSLPFDLPNLNVTGQLSSVPGTSRMAALPGAGALSRSLKSRSAAWSESDFKLHGKLHVSSVTGIGLA